MKLELKIVMHTGNAAFEDNPHEEIRSAIHKLSEILTGYSGGDIHNTHIDECRVLTDTNGNTIGKISIFHARNGVTR